MPDLDLLTNGGTDPTRVWWTPLVGLYHTMTLEPTYTSRHLSPYTCSWSDIGGGKRQSGLPLLIGHSSQNLVLTSCFKFYPLTMGNYEMGRKQEQTHKQNTSITSAIILRSITITYLDKQYSSQEYLEFSVSYHGIARYNSSSDSYRKSGIRRGTTITNTRAGIHVGLIHFSFPGIDISFG